MTAQPARKLTRKLITACLAACLLPIALPMLPATAAPGYKAPKRKAAQRTEGTGGRNGNPQCTKDLDVPLTLVMPKTTEETVPETTLAAPPLYVYLAKPKKLLVILYEQRELGSVVKAPKALWSNNSPQVQSGIVKIDYPASQKPLEIGKTYTWKVEIDCGLDSNGMPSYAGGTAADMSRVAVPEALQQQLQQVTSARQRAEIYAKSGLWTETLTAIAEARAGGKDVAADQDLKELLNQIGLEAIAKRELNSSPTPAPQPAVTPSPTSAITPKPTDPKKPCH
jgi:Domain of Unknown Function (DUF928)